MTSSKFSFYSAAAAAQGPKGAVLQAAGGGSLEVVPTVTVARTESEEAQDKYATLNEAAVTRSESEETHDKYAAAERAASIEEAGALDIALVPPPPPPPGPPPRPPRRPVENAGETRHEEESARESADGAAATDVCKPNIAKAGSNVSEATYETMEETITSSSSTMGGAVPSASSTVIEDKADATPKQSSAPPAASRTLALMMRERLSAIDSIRTLLETESQNDVGIRSEFTGKVRTLEKSVASKKKVIAGLQTEVQTLTSKNEEYSVALGNLGRTVNELTQSNHGNVARVAELEKEAAAKDDEIERLGEDVREKTLAFDKANEESAALVGQLATLKAENDRLESTVEGLQSKNGEYASELESLASSVGELVEQNTGLEEKVDEVTQANAKLEQEALEMTKKDDELLDVVEELTASLTEAQKDHKADLNKLKQQNHTLKAEMVKEKENSAAIVRSLEESVAEATTQSTDQLEAQKASYEQQIALLAKELEEAKALRKSERVKNAHLQDRIAEASRAATASADATSGSIARLEKDLEEEFRIANKLKRDMEALKKRSLNEESEAFADDLEELLSGLRRIQCWQLSHFQRINKLVGQNEDQGKSNDAAS